MSGFAVGSSPEDMRTAGRVVATREAVAAGAKKAEPAITATSMTVDVSVSVECVVSWNLASFESEWKGTKSAKNASV